MPKVKYTPRRGSKAADTGRKGEATGGKTGNKGKRKGKNGGGGPKKGVKGGAKKPAAKDILRTTVTRKQNSERTISPFLGGGSVVQSSSAAASRGAPVRDDRPVRDETSSVLGRQRKEKSNAERRNFSNSSSSTDQSLVNRTQAQSSSNSSSDWPLEQTLQRETAQSSKKISLKGMVSATGERRQPKGKRNVSRWSEGADGEQDSSHLPTEVDTVRGREGGKRRRREEVGVNSDSEKGGERGKKRRRRRGEEVGANSSDSGEEGGERRGRSRVREVRVSATSLDKWKPVSLVARKLLSDAMVSALGYCLDGVRGARKRTAETAIQCVMQRVELEVAAVKAPPSQRVKSCADLKQRVTELKEKCIGIVHKNQEIAQRVEERTLFCEERRQGAQQLEAVMRAHPMPTHCLTSHTPQPPLPDSDDESFSGYIRDLLSSSTLPSTHTMNTTFPYIGT